MKYCQPDLGELLGDPHPGPSLLLHHGGRGLAVLHPHAGHDVKGMSLRNTGRLLTLTVVRLSLVQVVRIEAVGVIDHTRTESRGDIFYVIH